MRNVYWGVLVFPSPLFLCKTIKELKPYLTTLLLLLLISTTLNAQKLLYAKGIGGAATEQANDIAVGAAGSNTYVTGYFTGTVDFDPGAGVVNRSSAGLEDIFIAKYDVFGNYLDVKIIGGAGSDVANAIVIDAIGNTYITGRYGGTVDFDPGLSVANLTNVGSGDVFFAKFDASGNYVFAKSIGGAGSDNVTAIAVDACGNIFITGHFSGTADFDPASSVTNLTSTGSDDIFIAKYTASGNYVYAKSLPAEGSASSTDIAIDGLGNIYIIGSFRGTIDFDPAASTATKTSNSDTYDAFWAKYDPSGNYLYVKLLAGFHDEFGHRIELDASGNVYIHGYTNGATDFDPGPGTISLSGAVFFAKYNASGNYIYAKMLNEALDSGPGDMVVDNSGSVYITGYFAGTIDFDLGPGTAKLTSFGGYDDVFLAKYNAAGNYVYAIKMGGAEIDKGTGIAMDAAGNAYVTGKFKAKADFDPGTKVFNLNSTGPDDIFIAKYGIGYLIKTRPIIKYAIKAGINFSKFTIGILPNSLSRTDVDNGFYAGAQLLIPINKTLSLQPEVFYIESRIQNYDAALNSFLYKEELKHLSIPLLLKLKIGHLGMFIGPQVSFLLSANITKSSFNNTKVNVTDSSYKKINVAEVFGLEYTFSDRFGVDVRYQVGFSNIRAVNGATALTYEEDQNIKLGGFQTGVYYRFGKK